MHYKYDRVGQYFFPSKKFNFHFFLPLILYDAFRISEMIQKSLIQRVVRICIDSVRRVYKRKTDKSNVRQTYGTMEQNIFSNRLQSDFLLKIRPISSGFLPESVSYCKIELFSLFPLPD